MHNHLITLTFLISNLQRLATIHVFIHLQLEFSSKLYKSKNIVTCRAHVLLFEVHKGSWVNMTVKLHQLSLCHFLPQC